MKNITPLLIALILFISTKSIAQGTPQQLKDFDTYVEKSVADWQTPGLAIVVCKGNEVLFSKGYGVRELGKSDKVDTKTTFACASTTKAMTAAAMAMLVDEGKVRWQDKVVQHLPDFKVADVYLTNELTIRDLFTHNGGMGNADFLWGYSDFNSDDILKRFALMKPAYSLRSSFIYQNVMYLVAGKVIEKLSGMTWADFLKKRIFDPLSMKRTFPTLAASKGETNRSRPHDRVKGVIMPIEDTSADDIAPAGSVWSCVEDMSKWMRFMLDSGRVNGKMLISPVNYLELFKVHSIVTSAQFYPTAILTKPNWMTYGLGWFQHDYKGRMVQFHTGSLQGTVAIHGLIPSEKIGVYVFGNLDHSEIRHAFMYRAFDMLMNEKERDWSSEMKPIYDGIRVQVEAVRKQKESQRILNTKPSLDLEKYTGTYYDPISGKIEVKLDKGQLVAKLSSKLSMTLEHWHYDTFKVTYDKAWFQPDYVSFILDENGRVAKLQSGGQSWDKK